MSERAGNLSSSQEKVLRAAQRVGGSKFFDRVTGYIPDKLSPEYNLSREQEQEIGPQRHLSFHEFERECI